MNFADRIQAMVSAVELGDGPAVAACFTPDGIYHDVFYGDFQGPKIADMIENYFHRDASDFRWDIHDPVEQDGMGYARYVFSYQPKNADGVTRRAIFEGVTICRMRGDLIADYREVANAATGLDDVGFAPERLAKFIGKQGRELKARAEAQRHID